MKFFYLTIFLVTSFVSAQTPLEFEKIIETNESKESVFPIIKEWIATKFVSANDVIQMEDIASGIFVIKGKSPYYHPKALYSCYNGTIEFTLKIEVRNNRFRIQLFDLNHIANVNSQCALGPLTTASIHSTKGLSKGYNNKVWVLLKEDAFVLASRVIDGLEKAVNQKNSKDEW